MVNLAQSCASLALKGIMARPALNQSLKGLLTAGLRKSVVYAGRKMGKWWNAKVSFFRTCIERGTDDCQCCICVVESCEGVERVLDWYSEGESRERYQSGNLMMDG
jgi:hypothetical protein